MELDRVALRLRPRNPWEAMDLGCAMLRRWRAPALRAWLLVYLPVVALLCFALPEQPLLAVLVLWWLKPAFDRAVLHVLGGEVFGAVPSAAATLGALVRAPGLIASLTLYRFSLARSFDLPVWQLERLRGGAARARAAVLHPRARGHAVWLTLACGLFELVVIASLFGLIDLLTPEPYERRLGWPAMFAEMGGAGQWWHLLQIAFYATAVSVVEPLYVAAGFALYLNRRTQLEAWDVELALRRIEGRAEASHHGTAAVLIVGCALFAALAWQPGSTCAQPAAPAGAAEHIREVLKDRAFDQYREVNSWRYVGPEFSWGSDGQRRAEPHADWENLGRLFAEVARALMWGVGAALLAAAIYLLARYWPALRSATIRDRLIPPAALFGMDIRPDSLPQDIPAAARALIDAGAVREALSLLYRGALSALTHRERLTLGAGDTEHDCVREVRAHCAPPVATYFAQLVALWQAAAYASRPPERAAVYELCAAWAGCFAAEAL